jgi:hypothetical protein
MHLGRHAEAAADFEDVVQLTRDSRAGELFRAFHAMARAHLDDLSALALLRNEVRDILRIGAGFDSKSPYVYYMCYYDASCIQAALAKLALQDQGKPPAERQRLADLDLERSMDFLDKARTAGEFDTGAIRLDEVRRETLLNPLRSHPRFQLLTMDLAFPVAPFATARGATP